MVVWQQRSRDLKEERGRKKEIEVRIEREEERYREKREEGERKEEIYREKREERERERGRNRLTDGAYIYINRNQFYFFRFPFFDTFP